MDRNKDLSKKVNAKFNRSKRNRSGHVSRVSGGGPPRAGGGGSRGDCSCYSNCWYECGNGCCNILGQYCGDFCGEQPQTCCDDPSICGNGMTCNTSSCTCIEYCDCSMYSWCHFDDGSNCFNVMACD